MAALTDSQRWMLLAGLALLGVLLYLVAPVLTPFIAGALIAYLFDPLADRLERFMPRTMAVVLVFLVIILILVVLVLLLIPLVERQVTTLVENMPDYVEWVETRVLPWLERHFGMAAALPDFEALRETVADNWRKMGGIAAGVMKSLTQSGMTFVLWMTNLVLIPVVAFFLLREWDVMMERIRELIPRRVEPTVTALARECDAALGGFLRGQLGVMIALGIVYSVGLWLAGLDLALMIGMIAGLLSFVPFLGFAIGLLMAVIAALAQFQDAWGLVPVLAVFAVGQVLESMVLTPYIVGDRIGLHPVAVIFAVMVGGQLFGFSGMLLALPASAVIVVLARHAARRYRDSRLYKSTP